MKKCPQCQRCFPDYSGYSLPVSGEVFCSRGCCEKFCHDMQVVEPQQVTVAPKPQEPLRKSYTRQELIEEAMAWARDRYEGEERYRTIGLLVDFVTDMHDKEAKK